MANNSNQTEHPKQYDVYQTNGKQKQETESDTTILMLNDDCLLHLCQYLRLWDMFKFGQTCARLKSLVENYIYPKWSSINSNMLFGSLITEKMSQHDVDAIFENMGPYIKQLKANCDVVSMIHNNFFSTIHKNLKNLRKLHLLYLDLDKDTFEKCIGTFNQLEVLALGEARIFRDEFFQFFPKVTHLHLTNVNKLAGLSHLEHLQQLTIKYCESFVGDELNHLKHLEQLEIGDCVNLIPEKLLACLKENPQIVQLKLWEISISQCSGFETVISNLKSLEYLSLYNYDGWPLDKLDSLKSIELHWGDVPSFKKLATKGQLEELNLTMRKTFADTDTDLQVCILSFKKLKTVTFYGTWFTEEFLLRMTKELDLKSLTVRGIQLTDNATVQLVKHSQNLEFLCYWRVTVTTIREIIKLVNGDPHRPKLFFEVGDKEDLSLYGTYDRVKII